jgi:hypothetical protein
MGAVVFDPQIMSISAGTTWASGSLSFVNSNGVTFGINGNTITASIGAAPEAGIGGIAAGTQTATTGTVQFVNSNSISFGMAGSASITASISVVTTPITVFSQYADFQTNYTLSPGVVSYQKISLPMPLSGNSGVVMLDVSGHSNSSGAITVFVGAYQISGGTAASLSSASGTFSWTSGSATTAISQYGGVSGTRYRSFPWDFSMTPGDYLMAFAVSTQNDGTARIFGRQGVNLVGSFAGAETLFFIDGTSAATTDALPTTVFASDTNYARTGLQAAQQPGFVMIGTF